MRLNHVPIAATMLVAVLSGCLAGDGANVDLPSGADLINSLEGYVDPFILGHDHADIGLHQLSFHVEKLYHHPLGGDRTTASGAHSLATAGDWLVVGAWGQLVGQTGGLYVFNVQDPEQPKLTGSLAFSGAVGGDRSLGITEDANWAVLGTESMTCGNQISPFQPGLYLIDLRDKTNPKVSDYKPSRGVHSVSVGRVNGADYSVSLFSLAPGTVTGAAPALKTLATNIHKIDASTGQFADVGRVSIGHDTRIEQDALLGKPLLYVANVTGLSVYDFSDPAQLKLLGKWAPQGMDETFDAAAGDHYIHAIDAEVMDGRRILAIESEDLSNKPSPLWVVDATDFEAMEQLSTWINPAGVASQGDVKGDGVTTKTSVIFSTHNPRVADGRVYLSHYHGGAWILDISTPAKQLAPEVMGYFLPDENNGGFDASQDHDSLPVGLGPVCYGGLQNEFAPSVYDVEFYRGVLYVADDSTGLYAVRHDPSVLPAPGHH